MMRRFGLESVRLTFSLQANVHEHTRRRVAAPPKILGIVAYEILRHDYRHNSPAIK